MKILLINPKTDLPVSNPIQIPPGLAYIAAVLEKDGHEVSVFDTTVEDRSLDEELEKAPDLVGITANTATIEHAWEIAARVKKAIDTTVVLGGPHPTILPDESLSLPQIDIVVRGEGEETVIELCRKLEEGRDIAKVKGISLKKNGKIVHTPNRPLIKDLDKLPYPAYHLFKFEKYSNAQPLLTGFKKSARSCFILTSRGCPYRCIYCSNAVFGRKWRARSPENVVREWGYLIENLNPGEIVVQDDVFNINKDRAVRICELLIREKLNTVPWIAVNGLRADLVDHELLEKMKEAGCYRVGFGIESGSQRILNIINKKLGLDQVRYAMKAAKEVGLETMGFFMIGNPGENEETMEATIKFALELDPDFAFFAMTTPFPGTELYELVLKKGRLLLNNWREFGTHYYKPAFELEEVTEDLVEKKCREAYRRFYFRPKRVVKLLLQKDGWKNLPLRAHAAMNLIFTKREHR